MAPRRQLLAQQHFQASLVRRQLVARRHSTCHAPGRRTDGEPPAQTMIDADSNTHQHPTYAIMRIIKPTPSGGYRKTRFSGTEAMRMTTTLGDSAARGKHVIMRHQSLACMKRAKTPKLSHAGGALTSR
eukprot:1582463-Prymnesium_polylepis.1